MIAQVIIPIMMPMPSVTGELPEWVLYVVIGVCAIVIGVCIWAIIELLKE